MKKKWQIRECRVLVQSWSVSAAVRGVCRQVTPPANVAMLITVMILMICLNAVMKSEPQSCGRALLVIGIMTDKG